MNDQQVEEINCKIEKNTNAKQPNTPKLHTGFRALNKVYIFAALKQ